MSDQEYIEQELRQDQTWQKILEPKQTSPLAELYEFAQYFRPWPNGGE